MLIVVCGFPRSGTTLIYNMLRSTVQGFTFHDREVGIAHRDTSGNKIVSLNDGPQIIKRPNDIMNIQVIEQDSQMQAIVMVRDPRDIITSKHAQMPTDFFVDCDFLWYIPPSGEPTKTNPGLIPLYRHLKRSSKSLVIKYEDLVTDPNGTQQRIAESVGLATEGLFSDFYHGHIPDDLKYQLNGVRPVDQHGIGRWRDFPARIIQQVEQFPELLNMIVELGYESDNTWYFNLKNNYVQSSKCQSEN